MPSIEKDTVEPFYSLIPNRFLSYTEPVTKKTADRKVSGFLKIYFRKFIFANLFSL